MAKTANKIVRIINYVSHFFFENILYKQVYNYNDGINKNFCSLIIIYGIITE